MIVKIIRPGLTGYERALASYVLDLKRELPNRPEYAQELRHGGEKVEWARTVNTGVDHPRWAIEAIELHNARNTRRHAVSRMEHVVVSFQRGERPTREQMAEIEDRLMRSIGFGDHPRVSAVHKPGFQQHTGHNWHLHIAVSRIDPVTLKAEHPRRNHFTLQAEAARLELDLGLARERKTILRMEREEIEQRREAIDAAAQRLHRDAAIDRVASGWRKATVEDVAAELSSKYADARRDAKAAGEKVDALQRAVSRAEQDQAIALHRMEERRSELGGVRAWLHDVSGGNPQRMSLVRRAAYRFLGDEELDRWRGSYRAAGRRRVEAVEDLQQATKALEMAEKAAVDALRDVQLRATSELRQREETARRAREEQDANLYELRERVRGRLAI